MESQPASAPSTSAPPAYRPFTVGLWLLWIGAAALNEALLDGVLSLLDAWPSAAAFLLLPLLGPVAVAIEWLVLRRALPALPWPGWLLANAVSGTMTFACWLALSISTPSDSTMTLATGVTTLVMGMLGAAALAVAVSCVAGRFPIAFMVCSVVSAFVVPLDLAIEHGPIRYGLIMAADDFRPLAYDWLSEREFLFLPLRPVDFLPDSNTIFLLGQALARVAANALGAAITGFGLWRFCRPASRAVRHVPLDQPRLARRSSLALAIVTGLCVLFANRDLSYLDQPPKEEISTGTPILAFAFESGLAGRYWPSPLAWAWSADSRYLTAAYNNGVVRRFDVERHRIAQEIRLEPLARYVAFSSGGRHLAARQGEYGKGDRGVVLFDGETLTEVARRPGQIDECSLEEHMTFGSDGALWVGCNFGGSGAFTKPLAIKLGMPDLATLDVLRVETTRGREGNGTSISLDRFFRGARDILVAEEHTREAATRSDEKEDPTRSGHFLRVIDLNAGHDLVPPVDLSPGPFYHTVQEPYLWRGGTRLIVPADRWVAAARRGEVSDAEFATVRTYRVFDLETGTLVNDKGGSEAPGRPVGAWDLPHRIERLGVVVDTTHRKRSGRILVLDERTGRELQTIETVSQLVKGVSPDGRWVVAERWQQRDGCTLRFYRVRP